MATQPRARKRDPEATRRALVDAAAAEFNRAGYHGTDSNRIARAAGYAPGTFYKHFDDKADVFGAVYGAWIVAEWDEIRRAIAAASGTDEVVSQVVKKVLAHHRKWRGLRASLHDLVMHDDKIRATYREQRREQLLMAAEMRKQAGCQNVRGVEETACLLYLFERTCDAIATGEARELRLGTAALVACLERALRDYLSE